MGRPALIKNLFRGVPSMIRVTVCTTTDGSWFAWDKSGELYLGGRTSLLNNVTTYYRLRVGSEIWLLGRLSRRGRFVVEDAWSYKR